MMRTRISVLIFLVVILQLLVCAFVLGFGGEFRDLEETAYGTLAEKTRLGSIYIRNELEGKNGLIREYAGRMSVILDEVLAEHMASADDIKLEKGLGREILAASGDTLGELLNSGAVSEAYLILDTGDLYENDEDGAVLRLYDENTEGGIDTVVEYSAPLVSGDGTVCGVLGIGLSRELVRGMLPTGDDVCYLLAYGRSDEDYDIVVRSGTFSAALGSAGALHISGSVGENVYSFDRAADLDILGSIQPIDLQGQGGAASGGQWAIVSVSAVGSVQHSSQFLLRMLVVSALLSLIVVAIVTIPGSGLLIKPISNLSKALKVQHKANEVIRFKPTNIYEIDDMTDAITQLQINVQEFSGQVSKMISIADVGLGTFMYDRSDDSVFIGQSLINVLKLDLPEGEDVTLSRRDFLLGIKNTEVRSIIAAGLGMEGGSTGRDSSEVHRISQPDGPPLWYRIGYTYSPNTAIGIVQDITEAMIERTRIEHERDHDNLTDLLTRPAYYRRLEELYSNKEALKITAFVMIDLDNLKYVNDTYGHDFGDSYITAASNVLKKFRDHGGIVARLSGDEFNVCLPGFDSKDEVRKIISDIRDELLESKCLLADGTHYNVGASMGVSWYPDDAENRELLMKYADFAMYTVKHSVKGGIAEFDAGTYGADSDKLADLEELNRIIDGDGVRYAFQSIVDAKTGEIYGYEALMRLQSEIFQSPLELLNIAKTSAKLREIERLTWVKSLADFRMLLDAGRVDRDAHLFVNSIANQTLDDEVILVIERMYPQLRKNIVMEILESDSADETSIAHKRKVIHRWGGQFALDDYGTGYNSEYALLSIRPNIIKVDRSIISGCDHDADRRMIIENLVKLSRAKGIKVLAEGVETGEEMDTVIACGVDYLQGYYLARPQFDPSPLSGELKDRIRRASSKKS